MRNDIIALTLMSVFAHLMFGIASIFLILYFGNFVFTLISSRFIRDKSKRITYIQRRYDKFK